MAVSAPRDGNVATYRDAYRREHFPARYRGALHLLFTFGVAGPRWCCACCS